MAAMGLRRRTAKLSIVGAPCVNPGHPRLSAHAARGRVGGSGASQSFGVRIVIDPDGYRPNVGIVLMHPDGRVFWRGAFDVMAGSFPQGGMNTDETPLEAMYREFARGNGPGARARRRTRRHPRLVALPVAAAGHPPQRPNGLHRPEAGLVPVAVHRRGDGPAPDLTDKPEFDHWRWVDFWYPLEHVVIFKRGVYASALRHLAPFARQLAGVQAIPRRRPRPGRGRRRDSASSGFADRWPRRPAARAHPRTPARASHCRRGMHGGLPPVGCALGRRVRACRQRPLPGCDHVVAGAMRSRMARTRANSVEIDDTATAGRSSVCRRAPSSTRLAAADSAVAPRLALDDFRNAPPRSTP